MDAEKPKEEEEALPQLRTMKYDAEHYLKNKHVSFLDLVADEQKRKTAQPFEFKEKISEAAWFRAVLGLILLVFLGVGGYAVFIYLSTRPVLPGSEAPQARSFVPVEAREIITVREGDRAGLLNKLAATYRDRLPAGSIRHVVLRFERPGKEAWFVTLEEFFATLDFKPPPGLTFSFANTFDFLIYYTTNGAHAGLVLEPNNYERALGHMRAWEPTMILDLKMFYIDRAVSPTSRLFEDLVIKNIDVRTLPLDDAPALSYAFFARRLMLLTTSNEFMEVLINRLLVSPPVR